MRAAKKQTLFSITLTEFRSDAKNIFFETSNAPQLEKERKSFRVPRYTLEIAKFFFTPCVSH